MLQEVKLIVVTRHQVKKNVALRFLICTLTEVF